MNTLKLIALGTCLIAGSSALASGTATQTIREAAYDCALKIVETTNASLIAAMGDGLQTVNEMEAASTASAFVVSTDGTDTTPAFRVPAATHTCTKTVLSDIEYAVIASKPLGGNSVIAEYTLCGAAFDATRSSNLSGAIKGAMADQVAQLVLDLNPADGLITVSVNTSAMGSGEASTTCTVPDFSS